MKKLSILNKANDEINWIIKNVKSATSKNQLDSCLECFFLWDKKFKSDRFENPNVSARSYLKDKFWSSFSNKKEKIVSY